MVLGALAAHPSPAAAQTAAVPSDVAENLDAVQGFIEKQGLPNGRDPVECTTVCSDLWLQEHRPMPGQMSSEAMHAELLGLEEKVGLLPKLARFGSVTFAAIGAFDAGWTIGTGLRHLFFKDNFTYNQPGAYEIDQYHYVDAGDIIHCRGNCLDENLAYKMVLPYPVRVAAGTNIPTGDWDVLTMSHNCATGFDPPQDPPQAISPWFFLSKTGPCIFGGAGTTTDTYFLSRVSGTTDPATDEDEQHKIGHVEFPEDPPGPGDTAEAVKAKIAGELVDHPDDYPNLNSFITSTVEEPPDRYDMPDCRGLLLSECLTKLEQDGFTGVHHTVTVAPEDAIVSAPPSTVIETNPERGSRVRFDQDVTITRNPLPDQMPTVVPTIVPGSTPATVEKALEDARLKPSFVTAPTPDPTVGPYVVTHTPPTPRTGARVQPHTVVTVEVNPDDAPDPPNTGTGTGGGGSDTYPFTPPDLPAINLDPLREAINCTTFPFGVPCYLAGALGGFSGDGHAPVLDLSLPFGQELHADFSIIDPALAILRPVMLVCSTLALAWLFMAAAMGFGGSGATEE